MQSLYSTYLILLFAILSNIMVFAKISSDINDYRLLEDGDQQVGQLQTSINNLGREGKLRKGYKPHPIDFDYGFTGTKRDRSGYDYEEDDYYGYKPDHHESYYRENSNSYHDDDNDNNLNIVSELLFNIFCKVVKSR